MTTATLSAPVASASTVDDVDHLYCCDPDVATCGIDLSHIPEGFEFGALCRLCAHVERERTPCRVATCGWRSAR
jgi:hypothetical protein